MKLLTGKPTRKEIEEAERAAGERVGAGGTAWVYFAGHGSARSDTRERILLPVDTLGTVEDFDAKGVRVAELQRLAGGGGVKARPY